MTFASLATSVAACASGPAANTGGTTASSTAPSTTASPPPSATAPIPSATASVQPSTTTAPTVFAPPIPSDTGPVVNAPMYGAPPPFNSPGPGIGAYGAPFPGGLGKGPASNVVVTKAPPGEGDARHLKARIAGLRACHQVLLATDPTHKAVCKAVVSLGGGAPAKATVVCTPASPSLEACVKKRLETGAVADDPAHTFDASLSFSPQN